MRIAAYAWTSTALAVAVVLRAFHERPNFYSACVYLGQSNASRMILLNLLLITASATLYGLQRFLYGPLRAIEIEQLWDRAWYAITETALAMTTFREEIGGWFFVMLISLLAGKVWGWIGEGRVETLEQQPPANPRLFHTRLMASLLLAEVFDLLMLQYCVRTLADDPRPGMMVMFAFEFAVLAIISSSTIVRYMICLREKMIIQRQTKIKIEERLQEMRAERQEARREAIANGSEPPASPRAEDVDENEIDVPGWQEKGRFILFLDLTTDFLKLVLYMGFFMILLFFSGIPIHMFRDLFITTRSFLKRINDYLKYRNATRDMNERYPDATAEDLARDGTCIICREEMRPWQPAGEGAQAGDAGQRRARPPMDERQRPKKLPCGHILHFGCLRSWLERQQVCPTCRRSVLAPRPTPRTSLLPAGQRPLPDGPAGGLGRPGDGPARGGPGGAAGAQGPNAGPGAGNDAVRARTFSLGSLRLTFATGNAQQVQNALQRFQDANATRAALPAPGATPSSSSSTAQPNLTSTPTQGSGGQLTAAQLRTNLTAIEQQISAEIESLSLARDQLDTVRALQVELEQLRTRQDNGTNVTTMTDAAANLSTDAPTSLTSAPGGQARMTGTRLGQRFPAAPQPALPQLVPQMVPLEVPQEVLNNLPQQAPLGSGHPDLPEGLVLPEGWSLLPLQRADHTSHGNNAERFDDLVNNPFHVLPQVHVPGLAEPSEVETSTSAASASADASTTDTTAASASDASATTPAPPPAPMPTPTIRISNGAGEVTHIDTSPQPSSNATSQRSSNGNINTRPLNIDPLESPATPSIALPNWGHGLPSASVGNSPLENESTAVDGKDESAGSLANGTHDDAVSSANGSAVEPSSGDSKGKGRAATVEDAADNDDT